MKKRLLLSAALLAAAPALADSPFAEFGGQPGISAVVDDFVANVLADPRIQNYFIPSQTPRLKYELKQQFCALLNGPCTYAGKDMKSAHSGMNITQAAFNALDEDLDTAMDKHGVPLDAQNYLTGKLAPMEQPIVTKN